jgi:hypothetical protein
MNQAGYRYLTVRVLDYCMYEMQALPDGYAGVAFAGVLRVPGEMLLLLIVLLLLLLLLMVLLLLFLLLLWGGFRWQGCGLPGPHGKKGRAYRCGGHASTAAVHRGADSAAAVEKVCCCLVLCFCFSIVFLLLLLKVNTVGEQKIPFCPFHLLVDPEPDP